MRPDVLLITEMIDAADQARRLADGITAGELEQDRQRRDALLWNFTVLGEAAGRLSDETKARFPDVRWQQPTGCVTGSCTATGLSTWKSCTPRPLSSSRSSSETCAKYWPR
jgi:hypothetical protein